MRFFESIISFSDNDFNQLQLELKLSQKMLILKELFLSHFLNLIFKHF